MLRPSRFLASAALALALVAPIATAQVTEQITIRYTGYGAGTGEPGIVVGKADDWAGLSSPIPGDWDVFRTEIYDLAARSMTGTFSFVDTGPGNHSLYGRFVGGWEAFGDMTHIRVFNNFVIEGGTGMFKGATGTGEDRVYTNFLVGQYVESGILRLSVTPVPEPGTALLFTAGAMALTVMRRRHRR